MIKKRVPHYVPTIAKGASMTPLITSAANLMLDISPNQIYRPGDIVAYIGYAKNIVVHRVLFVESASFGNQRYLLKGDHNSGTDRRIGARHLLGKVQKIVYPSYTIDLNTPLSFYSARSIAYCGRITSEHRWFCAIERIVIFCLTLVIMSCARWRSLFDSIIDTSI